MSLVEILSSSITDNGILGLAAPVIAALSIAAAVLFAFLQSKGRRIPAFLWVLGPILILTVGILGTGAGVANSYSELGTFTPPDPAGGGTPNHIWVVGHGMAAVFELLCFLLAAVVSAITALLAAWGIGKSSTPDNPIDAGSRKTTGTITVMTLAGMAVVMAAYGRVSYATIEIFTGAATASAETKVAVILAGFETSAQALYITKFAAFAVIVTLLLFIGAGYRHTLRLGPLLRGGVAGVLLVGVSLGVGEIRGLMEVPQEWAHASQFRWHFEDIKIPTIAQLEKSPCCEQKRVFLAINDSEVILEGELIDQGPATNGIYPGLAKRLPMKQELSRDINEAFSDVPGILDGEDEIWFAAQRDATWSDIKPVLNTLAAQKWKTTVLFAVRGPESDTFVRGYLPIATAETEPSEGDEATEPTEGDDAGEPATDEAPPAAPATDLYVGKNSWKRVVTRAGAEPETQTFDTLAALQTARKASPAPTEFSQLHLEDDVTVQALIDTLLVFNDGDEAWPRTVVLTVAAPQPPAP